MKNVNTETTGLGIQPAKKMTGLQALVNGTKRLLFVLIPITCMASISMANFRLDDVVCVQGDAKRGPQVAANCTNQGTWLEGDRSCVATVRVLTTKGNYELRSSTFEGTSNAKGWAAGTAVVGIGFLLYPFAAVADSIVSSSEAAQNLAAGEQDLKLIPICVYPQSPAAAAH